MSALMEGIGRRIRDSREALGMTQADLARALWTNRQWVCNVEAGRKSPSLESAVRLCLALSVSADYLLGIDRGRPLRLEALEDRVAALEYSIATAVFNCSPKTEGGAE